MSAVILDTTPLGIVCNPQLTQTVLACRDWIDALLAAGRRVILPEIADYKLRREFIRRRASNAVANLDDYGVKLEYLPISTFAMRLAADLWAQARSTGQPTAPDPAIDGDVIRAAQALSLNVNVVVATGNPAHLARFVPADLWQNIKP